MSTQFPTPDSALDFGLSMAGVTRVTAQLVEDPDLRVTPMWLALIDEDDPDYAAKKAEALDGQKGYRGKNVDGNDFGLVVDRFRDGWCVWGVTPQGAAVRF